MLVQAGYVVQSIAGHDENGLFVVLSVENGRVLLADGRRRTLEKPKRKSLRHIRKTNTVLDLAGIETNKSLRRALHALGAHEGGIQLV